LLVASDLVEAAHQIFGAQVAAQGVG